MKGFNLYWGSAASLVFFTGIGLASAHFLHLQGSSFAFLMTLAGTMGITAAAFFYFFQRKAQAQMDAKAQAGQAAAAAAGAPGMAAGGGAPAGPAAAGGSPEL